MLSASSPTADTRDRRGIHYENCSKVVEAYLPKPGLPEEAGQRPLPEVRGVYGRPRGGREDEAPVFVAVAKAFHLVHLSGEMSVQCLYRFLA